MALNHDKHVSPFDRLRLHPWLASTYSALRNKVPDTDGIPEQDEQHFDLTEIQQELRSASVRSLFHDGNQSVNLQSYISPKYLKGTNEGLSLDSKLFQLLKDSVSDYDERLTSALNQAVVACFGISGQIESGVGLDVGGSLQAAHQLRLGALDILMLMVRTINGYKEIIDSLGSHLNALNMEHMGNFQGKLDEARKRREQDARDYQHLTEEDILSTANSVTNDELPSSYRALVMRHFDTESHLNNRETDTYDCWYRHGLTQRQIASLTSVSQSTIQRLINQQFPEALERLNAALSIKQQANELGLSVDMTSDIEDIKSYRAGRWVAGLGSMEETKNYASDLSLKNSSGTIVAKIKIFRLPVKYPIKDAVRDGISFPGFSTDAPDHPRVFRSGRKWVEYYGPGYMWVHPATYRDFAAHAPDYDFDGPTTSFIDDMGFTPTDLVPDNKARSILNWCSWRSDSDAAVAIIWEDGKVSIHPSGKWEDTLVDLGSWDWEDLRFRSVDDWFNQLNSTMFSEFLDSFQATPPKLHDYLAFVGAKYEKEKETE